MQKEVDGTTVQRIKVFGTFSKPVFGRAVEEFNTTNQVTNRRIDRRIRN